jgi:3-hydroxyacyl-CoA dehydrogenase/enoyl-CoA hydratase/3-hydroxybutyryl-CoA epimerase
MIRYKKDASNIVTLTMDMANRKVNVINHNVGKAFIPVLKHLQQEHAAGKLNGVILTSNKRSFLAGGDLEYLHTAKDATEIFQFVQQSKYLFRSIEQLGVPVVSAINGAALGSGFELTLATHYRIALDTPHTVLGLPEVTLGLMPGSGGVVRLLWMLGLEKAFPVLTEGYKYHAREALKAGILDDIAQSNDEMIEKAYHFILSKPNITKHWDKPDAQIPDGTSSNPDTARTILKLASLVTERYQNNYPQVQYILNTLVEAMSVDFDTANRIESRYFTQLVLSRPSQNMTKTFWYDMDKIHTGSSRPKGFGKFRPRQIGIIGAGNMGTSIAYLAARMGIEVILKDITLSIAQRGKDNVQNILHKQEQTGILTINEVNTILQRITPSDKIQDLARTDLVIEAVFENKDLKQKITQEAENVLDDYTILASNTSTLPISTLSQAVSNPQNFVGIHFFAPAHHTQLIEVVRGKHTSDETVAKAFDFVEYIRRIPLITTDIPGFFVLRCTATYAKEGIALLAEGISPNIIEQAGRRAGMPLGPLAVADDISMPTLQLLINQTLQANIPYHPHPADPVIQHMITLQRLGKNKNAGFYDYINNQQYLWKELPTLSSVPTVSAVGPSIEHIIERLLFVQVAEVLWCLHHHHIPSVADANVASIFGWGFPPFKGGAIQFIHDYGTDSFVAKALQLQQQYGNRFAIPPDTLQIIQPNP